ncbi:4Fe-4S binding protein [Halomonas sp. MCCC 1A17488]|uniref:4Fe-4S binding protein n=1 Tax=unclassified Halomonas TaxID=2609666 RepID=UPI0018D22A38|nr:MULTISPECIES: 4Fe-4S binding protein [unclassified Halomonas]MCE8017991.1 4Fe-4S binding protein [Halomonas sp. MCCC 1A17488]MCG3241324.1 4Fe-4S binding protein [Halomonas sp. MCCC 1A17488]QPP48710.1 4Fe-4S binding protein [Halomonas sp. SS10-MC5]
MLPLRSLVLAIVLLLASPTLLAEPSPEMQARIQQLFPKATRIEDKRGDTSVYPVYQLDELLGYAYESRDIRDLPGYSGRPIGLLIGLDVDGIFTGVQVLDHHEPVFLHGLGEAPLQAFVGQYRGRSLTEHIVVSSRRAGSGTPGGTVYIDGVTSATVSVIIINDTVLSSAIEVARSQLEAFAQKAATRPRQALYEPLTWRQMVDRGYIGHWRISVAEAEAALGAALSRYPELPAAAPDDAFLDLYYAYVSAPMVGRNLLGDEAFSRLADELAEGRQILAVMSSGLVGHVAQEFRPQSVAERLSLEQGQLAVALRDMDRLPPEAPLRAEGMPAFRQAHLFEMGGSGGFNPGADADLVLDLPLARNPLVADRAEFRTELHLPDELFEPVAVSAPLARPTRPAWVGVWQERWLQVTLLMAGLTVLSVLFAGQHRFSRYPRGLHRFRWGFLFFTLLFIGFYAQGQLSVVNVFTLLLALYDGFELGPFLLDPVLFVLWSFTFATLFLWGRGLFCGWLCPFGAMQEMASWLGKRLGLRQRKVPGAWHRRLVYLKYLILIVLLATAFHSPTLAERLAEVEPFKTSLTLYFWRAWPFVAYAVGLLLAGMVVHKVFCRYLCPLGAGLAILGRFRLFSWLTRIEACGQPCQLCHQRCEINAIRRDGSIDYDECIQCLECLVILHDDDQCVDKRLRRKRRQRDRITAVNVA